MYFLLPFARKPLSMGLFALFNHLFNFVLPAIWLASLLLLTHRVLARRRDVTLRWQREWLWLFVSGVLILLLGMLPLQRDGGMLTYVALALGMGGMQQWLLRHFRRREAPATETEDLPVAPWHQGDTTRH